MMKQMMGQHAATTRGMPSAEGLADAGPMAKMMSPERVEGRIAILRTEIKVTGVQQPLLGSRGRRPARQCNVGSGVHVR